MTHQAPVDLDRIRQLDFSSGQVLGKSNQGEVRRFRVEGRELAIKMPKGRGLAWRVRQATLKREFLAYQRLAGVSGFPFCHGLVDDTWLVLDHVEGQPFRDFRFTHREAFFARLLDTIQAMHARLKREFLAYQRLAGVSGFPVCHGLVDDTWLVLDHVEGQPFRDFRFTHREAFFARLLDTIEAMHARGVAHGDLKRKANLLVTRDEQPIILDLGAATLEGHRFRMINAALFRFMRQTDLNAWVKLKHGSYQAVSEADRRYLKRSRLERLLTRIRGR